MATRIAVRLRQVEKAAARNAATPEPETHEQWAARFTSAFREDMPEIAAWIERHVLPHQRIPLMRLVVLAEDEDWAALEEWMNRPFAPWTVLPDDFVFPETLVNAFIAPAEATTMAGAPACEACGLRAPRDRVGDWSGDGFGCCPACFCPTTQAANDATGPVADSQPMAEKHRWPRVWRRGT
jgi:hypothetical protein